MTTDKKQFKAEIIEVHTGDACGKSYIRLSTQDKTIACIQPTSIDFCGLGCTQIFYVQVYGDDITLECKDKACHCWADVIEFIFGKMSTTAMDAIFGTITYQIDSLYKEFWK